MSLSLGDAFALRDRPARGAALAGVGTAVVNFVLVYLLARYRFSPDLERWRQTGWHVLSAHQVSVEGEPSRLANQLLLGGIGTTAIDPTALVVPAVLVIAGALVVNWLRPRGPVAFGRVVASATVGYLIPVAVVSLALARRSTIEGGHSTSGSVEVAIPEAVLLAGIAYPLAWLSVGAGSCLLLRHVADGADDTPREIGANRFAYGIGVGATVALVGYALTMVVTSETVGGERPAWDVAGWRFLTIHFVEVIHTPADLGYIDGLVRHNPHTPFMPASIDWGGVGSILYFLQPALLTIAGGCVAARWNAVTPGRVLRTVLAVTAGYLGVVVLVSGGLEVLSGPNVTAGTTVRPVVTQMLLVAGVLYPAAFLTLGAVVVRPSSLSVTLRPSWSAGRGLRALALAVLAGGGSLLACYAVISLATVWSLDGYWPRWANTAWFTYEAHFLEVYRESRESGDSVFPVMRAAENSLVTTDQPVAQGLVLVPPLVLVGASGVLASAIGPQRVGEALVLSVGMAVGYLALLVAGTQVTSVTVTHPEPPTNPDPLTTEPVLGLSVLVVGFAYPLVFGLLGTMAAMAWRRHGWAVEPDWA